MEEVSKKQDASKKQDKKSDVREVTFNSNVFEGDVHYKKGFSYKLNTKLIDRLKYFIEQR